MGKVTFYKDERGVELARIEAGTGTVAVIKPSDQFKARHAKAYGAYREAGRAKPKPPHKAKPKLPHKV